MEETISSRVEKIVFFAEKNYLLEEIANPDLLGKGIPPCGKNVFLLGMGGGGGNT